MKTIVTHIGPDLDAITSIWLAKTFLPAWEEASLAFVPAGSTLEGKPPDDNPEILHVDTGFGTFDHHQTDADTCAAKLVLEYLLEQNEIKKSLQEPLLRMIEVVKDFDHFREIYLPDPTLDIYDFSAIGIINGLKVHIQNDHKLVEISEIMLDGILKTFTNKVRAQTDIKAGLEAKTLWGRSLFLATDNREASSLAQKIGYMLVVTKAKNGQVRIKLRPDSKKNLKKIYKAIGEIDSKANWFYHASGKMLLNGSSKNPQMKPSRLTLTKLISLIKGF